MNWRGISSWKKFDARFRSLLRQLWPGRHRCFSDLVTNSLDRRLDGKFIHRNGDCCQHIFTDVNSRLDLIFEGRKAQCGLYSRAHFSNGRTNPTDDNPMECQVKRGV